MLDSVHRRPRYSDHFQTGHEDIPVPHHGGVDPINGYAVMDIEPAQPIDLSSMPDFWTEWQAHRQTLFRYCLGWLNGHAADAEDALSRACIRAGRKFADHRENIRNLKGWLTRLTFNVCMDMQRERDRHSSVMRHLHEINIDQGHTVEMVSRYEEERLLRNEFQRVFHIILDSLPCRLRLPASLHYTDDKSYREIAQTLRISTTNVRKRIQQARAAIQERLTPYLEGNDPFYSGLSDEAEHRVASCRIQPYSDNTYWYRNDTIEPNLRAHRMIAVLTSAGEEIQTYLTIGAKPARLEQRINTLRKYCALHPRTIKKCLELAGLLYKSGDWIEAIGLYTNLLDRKPELFQLRLRLGKMQHFLSLDDQAIQSFLHARRVTGNPATRCHLTGLINVCRNLFTQALGAFQKAAHYESENSAHWHAVGNVHLLLHQPEAAIRSFEQALANHPDDPFACIQLFEACMMLGGESQALGYLNQALAIEPDDILGMLKLADYRVKKGWVSGKPGLKTRRIIKKIMTQAPDSIDAMAIRKRINGSRNGNDRVTGPVVQRGSTENDPLTADGMV